ncbi:M23 family metallopeptidase [Vibrio gazogenes]|uniref:Murein DD-endopeptidase MepM and murein hydrolase activator NlpD, contain LysM domain n=1 Tax=Vibrio gazogenes DSM 21264 = NBRC 103151 TaxID=1123492 RepID=A0A1M4YHB2_VIBGA|nr:M23 family metallopeptidase [Vibrio gazogenes]USP14983.1 peptidoglycan DD-metalloendopeptidase family protein [Vibrio gazogenes]SHF05167.1 Murein DD-endopeptidase MepM and murein hydrolase activator NlpD, contain LysM domain [Vibrio gazogenes DSM 21264] [Vibrio gazogenes DSM 21264 = NBRC 103151]SJN55817.1 Murein DD-endopeptidase MepM [Vibrio gazogenes]
MKENLVISVSSINGTHHFYVGRWYQKFIKSAGYILMAAIISTAGIIYYLMNEVDFAKSKQKELENQSMSLSEDVASLKKLKIGLQSELLDREEKMQTVSDRLGDLEKVLGVSDSDDATIESRLDTAAITSSVRMVLLNQIPNGYPVPNARMSSGYGRRINPVTGKSEFHRGQDFSAPKGTKIYAPADGVVEVVRPSLVKGSGNYLRLRHSFGFSSSYSHMNKFAVKMGEFVNKGDLIGYVGNSGLSTGPHLHYEIRFVGRSLNPKPFVNWGINNFDTIFTKVGGVRWESLINNVEQRVSAQLQLSSLKVAPLMASSE